MRLNQQIRHLEVIHPHDSLSTQMCMDCICDLKMSYKFFMQIKKAEVKLKSIHVNLTSDSTAKKPAMERTNDSGTTKQEKQSSYLGRKNLLYFKSCVTTES